MDKKFKIASLGMTCLLLISALFLITACDNGDELSTDQMTDTGITVKAFGPSPALRGGELRFVGTNVDRATAVVIPGVPEITEFTKKEKTEIRVIIPQTAQEGYVILRTPQGDITPKTMLTFSEPIVIESITTTKVKSGDDFEVTGDYLNLIAKVVFQENVVVESTDFVSQSRERIVVKVPLKARSGEIMIANGEEIPIEVYSGDLQADIVEPAIVSVAPSTVKAGSDITITGVDFDLVEKVVFGGEKIVTEFTVSEDKKSITVTTPADAQDGPVMLVAYSGVEVISEASLTLKMPVATIENKKVKNGETVTITGTDLDLVTGTWFDELEAGFNYADGKLSVTVPETAVSDHIRFVTASTKELSITGISYVTPAILSIAPTSITAGDNITVTGTDLDLVREIIFKAGEGTVSVPLTSAPDESSITIQSPFTATSGTIDLKTVNETIVTSSQSLTIAAALLAAITEMPEAVKPGALLTVQGINLNTVTKIEFRYKNGTVVPATSFLPNQDGTSLQMYAPTALGLVDLILVNPVGPSVAYPLSIGLTDPITASTIMLTNFNGGGNSQSTWGDPFTFGIPSVPLDETPCMIGKSSVNGWLWSWAANWGDLPVLDDPNKYVFKMDICVLKAVPTGITAGMVFRGWDNSIDLGNIFANTTNGDWKTLTFELNPDNPINGTGDYGFYINASQEVDLSGVYIDNFRFDLK
ncbi:hypothetical protein ING2E5B_2183 [Fermentimonas caenicola]|jgi:hypothetical protein|uniref:IPT/TIG domain-containing protein n=1 Tax=Fermentimonas caenicola TaxID=1562970 RepID=A0A098C3A4_9BACT|nr:hypothetical protein ING2E5B_2183 [Fermentimonas caenicola]SEA09547.1 IPT/TIG domain-containing protein [Porphyromonadaceae bacterium KH3R12]